MFTIYQFHQIDSTNDEAKRHYERYANETLIVAKKQTKGRGRFDRVWESGEDLTFSLVFKNQYYNELLFPLIIVKALKVFEIDASIKWPNDILVNDKKVSGILIETIYEGNKKACSIVGIGINIVKKDGELIDKAGYVQVDRKQLLQTLLACFEQSKYLSDDEIIEEYLQYHYLYHHKLTMDGKCYTIDQVQKDGTLLVQNEDEKRYLRSEEVTLSMLYQEG